MTQPPSGVTVADVVSVLDDLYPPDTAEEWDAVGLTCGDRSDPARRVMFAVDPLPPVIDEALEWDADVLITHHPLLLRGVHSVATDTWKGRSLHRLIQSRCALVTAHTNADVAKDGVNDALAAALGLTNVEPLRPSPQGPSDKEVTLGRVGTLSSVEPLEEFARRVADAMPKTPAGVRVHGDLSRAVRRVAVCGGAGDTLLPDAAAAGVDAFVTADLRHHPASEHLASEGPALIDPGHWASEWPWLPLAARALLEGLRAQGHDPTTVETRVSSLVTDPVSAWLPGEASI